MFGRPGKISALSLGLFVILPVFWLALLLANAGHAAEEGVTPVVEPVPTPVIYPGLEEVVPRSSQIDADAARAVATLNELKGPDEFSGQFEKQQNKWHEFQVSLKEYGPQKDWPVNRLLNVRAQADNQSRALKQLLDQVGLPLKSHEDVRKLWTERLDYWEAWRSSLEKTGAKIPRQTFNKVRSAAADVLSLGKKKSTDLLLLQEKISRLREEVLVFYEKLDAEVTTLRRAPFKRNAHPLFSADYLNQLDQVLFTRVTDGVRAAFQIDPEFFKRQGWLLAIQAVLVVALIIIFRQLEISTVEKTDDWQFIFRRPVSAALFVALAAPRLFYAALPPPLLQLTILFIATICAARLASQLLKEGNQRTLIYTLAALFVVSKTLTTLALPLPLYRIYLTAVSIFGIPFLFWLARRHRAHFKGSFDRYLFFISVSKLVLLTALIAQISGYATFAQQLIEATIGTVFLLLFSLMALRITEGGVELVFHSEIVSATRFVKNLGKGATNRFSRLFRIAIFVVAMLYLLDIWGLFDTIGAAWLFIMGLEFSIGEFHLSVKMIVLVAAVLYAAILTSWFFQSFLESQFFHGKKIDRGVRDAFKKLSHYGFVLVGFLVAMTMAGIELQNFAILAGAFGIGIGFGLQEIVNNFVSGLILLFERPVKVGDAVIIDGKWGAINKIGMRSTVVETWDRSELIVPNSQMISEKVLNWTLSSNVSRVTVRVGVRYGTDLEKVIKILNKVGDGHPSVVADPPPSAIFTDFGDSSINFELRVWVDDIKNRLTLISDLGVTIDKEFKKAGIEIPYPQRDLHLKSISQEIDVSKVPRK